MNNIYEEEAKKRIKNNMKDVLKNTKEYQKNLENGVVIFILYTNLYKFRF